MGNIHPSLENKKTKCFPTAKMTSGKLSQNESRVSNCSSNDKNVSRPKSFILPFLKVGSIFFFVSFKISEVHRSIRNLEPVDSQVAIDGTAKKAKNRSLRRITRTMAHFTRSTFFSFCSS